MRQQRHSAKLLVTVLMTLLTGSLAGAPGLVLCLGADGHRAIELEHSGTECPTLASSQGAADLSVQPAVECLDLPAAGPGPTTPSSFDAARVPMPPVVFLPVSLKPAPHIEVPQPAPTDARAAPLDFAPHLPSTVLLV